MKNDILRIALPSIVTNITVPLLGIVDLAIAGHIPAQATDCLSSCWEQTPSAAAIIGALSVGTLIFNMVYWLFNFLRMGTSGLTAQAFGRGDVPTQQGILRMGLIVAMGFGLLLFLLQRPIEWAASAIIAPSAEVWTLAIAYFRIRIWAAPAVLALFVMNGWLVGMQNARYPMYIAIGQNLINIVLSYLLVFQFQMDIRGVALGTVISQYAGLAAALLFCWQMHRRSVAHPAASQDTLSTELSTNGMDNGFSGTSQHPNVDKNRPNSHSYQQKDVHIAWKTFFTVNRDIFLRMVCLIAVTTAFTAYGARMGDTLLAVNTLLMQLFTLFSYFSDGFALAGEALVGKAIGQRISPTATIRRLFRWGWGVTALFTLAYVAGGPYIMQLFTTDASVLLSARPYLPWACAIPVCGIAAFLWDGIFVGATRTRQMFLSLLISAFIFFGVFEAGIHLLPSSTPLHNHLLWAAFLLYLSTRGVVLWHCWKSSNT